MRLWREVEECTKHYLELAQNVFELHDRNRVAVALCTSDWPIRRYKQSRSSRMAGRWRERERIAACCVRGEAEEDTEEEDGSSGNQVIGIEECHGINKLDSQRR